MTKKEPYDKERTFAAEIMKIFAWSHPRIQTTELLFRKAKQLRGVVTSEEFADLKLAIVLKRLNIDQMKEVIRSGMNLWEREKMRARVGELEPLHLLKSAIREAAKGAEYRAVFEKIVEEVV